MDKNKLYLFTVLEGKLHKIGVETPTYKDVFQILREGRTRPAKTDLYQFQIHINKTLIEAGKNELTKGDVDRFFFALREIGIGSLETGPDNRRRFKWKFDSKSVGLAALGHENVLLPKFTKEDDQGYDADEIHNLTIRLRTDFEVKIILPLDLTPEEKLKIINSLISYSPSL